MAYCVGLSYYLEASELPHTVVSKTSGASQLTLVSYVPNPGNRLNNCEHSAPPKHIMPYGDLAPILTGDVLPEKKTHSLQQFLHDIAPLVRPIEYERLNNACKRLSQEESERVFQALELIFTAEMQIKDKVWIAITLLESKVTISDDFVEAAQFLFRYFQDENLYIDIIDALAIIPSDHINLILMQALTDLLPKNTNGEDLVSVVEILLKLDVNQYSLFLETFKVLMTENTSYEERIKIIEKMGIVPPNCFTLAFPKKMKRLIAPLSDSMLHLSLLDIIVDLQPSDLDHFFEFSEKISKSGLEDHEYMGRIRKVVSDFENKNENFATRALNVSTIDITPFQYNQVKAVYVQLDLWPYDHFIAAAHALLTHEMNVDQRISVLQSLTKVKPENYEEFLNAFNTLHTSGMDVEGRLRIIHALSKVNYALTLKQQVAGNTQIYKFYARKIWMLYDNKMRNRYRIRLIEEMLM
ncbi:MAG: hypothetical protein Q8K36_02915, partial [Alphaproteobacteria bacterium]|nr:hypothetical protein [Alphaproteobacteria bacterium]